MDPFEIYNSNDIVQTNVFENCSDYINKLKNLDINSCRNINILHVNIRSLNKNYNELVIFLEQLKEQKSDIIFLSESWHPENLQNFHIPGYDIYSNNAQFNQNDGIILYVKDNITVVNIDNINLQKSH